MAEFSQMNSVGPPQTERMRVMGLCAALKSTRRHAVESEWIDCENYILPNRSLWLDSIHSQGPSAKAARSQFILDSTPMFSANILGAGMVNGLISPSRPWFRVGVLGRSFDSLSRASRLWLEAARNSMFTALSASNFYSTMHTHFLDMVQFGTAATLIYEDDETIFRLYNSPVGEFYLFVDSKGRVGGFAREWQVTVRQAMSLFPDLSRWPMRLRADAEAGGDKLERNITVYHLIEPHKDGRIREVPKKFEFRETYWHLNQMSEMDPDVPLKAGGFNELNGIFSRWDIRGNSAYASGWPGIYTIPDVIQLQEQTRQKGKAVALQVEPPMLMEASLQNKPTPLMPRGRIFVSGLGDRTKGAFPVYQNNINLQDLNQDIQFLIGRIRQGYYNDLFAGISQLQTVRSAEEIIGRQEEKLINLGPVVIRTESEGLTVALSRVFNIMNRKEMFAEPPAELRGQDLEVTFTSLMNDAMAAAGTSTMERYLQVLGQAAALWPEARHVPDIVKFFEEYGNRLRIPASSHRDSEEIFEAINSEKQAQELAQAAELAPGLAQGAANLVNLEAGGGQAAAALGGI